MEIDLELYRKDILVSASPVVRLSVIDVAPDHPLQTIVFIHGYAGQALQWQYQLQAFSKSNRVIAIDLRGHGRSDKPRSRYTMEEILGDLEAVLDALGVASKFSLVGHSFGGAVVTEYALAHPERIDHLILIATAGEFHLNPLYRFLLRMPLAAMRWLDFFSRGWLGAPTYVLHPWYYNNLSKWVGWSSFRSLSVPTLVIRGNQDAVFEKPMFEEVTRAIPDADDVDVGASGHLVMLERRDAVNRAIQRFLELSSFSWRDSESGNGDDEYARMLRARPWLPHYDEGVPFTIAIPQVPLHHILQSSARRFPLKTALKFEGTSLHYRRLNQETNRFANAMLALGLEPGERVMLILPNIPQLVIAYFGTLKAGGVAVFTLPTHSPDELVRQVRDSGARILVTLTEFDDLIYAIKSKLEPQGDSPLKHILFAHIGDYLPFFKRLALHLSRARRKRHLLDIPLDASMYLFDRLLYSHSKDAPEVQSNPKDLAVIMYTGGTTAVPKGVMLSHYNLTANALQTRHWIPAAQEGQERFLCVLPFSHSYGLTAALNVPLALGATLILKPRFEIKDILKTIQSDRPTIFPGVPQMYVAIKDFPGVRKFGIQSIKACISGSAPLPVEVQEAFEKLTRGRLVEGYGLTEASPVTHANPLNGLRKVGTIGIPLPSSEARLVDLRRGKEIVPVGHIGELAVRGPQVMLGYWNDAEATRQVLSRDGWLLTGDVAQMDSEGYFRIVARKADMWYPARPGEPAFPRDVEEVLFEVPQVKEAAVVAIAGQPIAFVISRRERPTSDALMAYCKRRLPPELVPRMIIFLDDFPRTFIGKVLRRELAERFKLSKDSIEDATGGA